MILFVKLMDVGEGLNFLHSLGIVHGDLKGVMLVILRYLFLLTPLAYRPTFL